MPPALAGPQESFTLAKTVEGAHGLQYLSYEREYAGLPVYGGDVVVNTDGATVLDVVTGQRGTITVGTDPTLSAADALTRAKTQVASVEEVAEPVLAVHAATLTPRLAWDVTVTGRTRDGKPTALRVFVDAEDGSIVDVIQNVRNLQVEAEGEHNGRVLIDVTGTPEDYTLVDPTRPGVACGGQDGRPYRILPEQPPALVRACVDVMYGQQRQWDMLRTWLGRHGIDGQGRGFPGRVGFVAPGAWWATKYALFGANTDGTFQMTSMDVVAHEYGHAIFQTTPGGPGSGEETAALNESTGDIFGALTEHYAGNPVDPPDYEVGEKVDFEGKGPLRYMYDPSKAGDPNCYTGEHPEPHAGAGVQNHWFYLLAEGTNPPGKPASPVCQGRPSLNGIGIQNAGKIYMAALNMKTLPWTHQKARAATIQAARALFPQNCSMISAVQDAWNAVSVPAAAGEPACFDLWLEPASRSVEQGAVAVARVDTSTTSTPAPAVLLSAGALPPGVSAALSPSTVQGGQSATLTLATSAATPAGTHVIEVRAVSGAITRTRTFSLTVTVPQGPSAWVPWKRYSVGDQVTYRSTVYTCRIAHTSQPDWVPPAVPALWRR
ncbi:M4 family metallopeptidase [Nonomuraea sp. NPDC050328]|uniref:M4 family metallopeptidase n=1 Tax=Nonomuraea sp. NPDC050328 TaxID=3364361 RepID=UPI00379B6472